MRALRTLPVAARLYVLAVSSAAVICVIPVVTGRVVTDWPKLLVLAVLFVVCEQASRCPPAGRGAPVIQGSCYPVLLGAVMMLSPSCAALVVLPTGLAAWTEPLLAARFSTTARAAGRTPGSGSALASAGGPGAGGEQRTGGERGTSGEHGAGAADRRGDAERNSVRVRRIWHAAQLAVSAAIASQVYGWAGGPASLAAMHFPVALLPAALAALAFCLASAVLMAGALVAAERSGARVALRRVLLASLVPHLAYGVVGLTMAVLWREPYGPLAAVLILLPMYVSCWVFAQYHREQAAHHATVRALVQAVDLKDEYTRGHSERVSRASVMIGREIGMTEDRLGALRFAGVLHDVGKLGVPTRVLRKSGPLTPEERRAIQMHPEYGHEMVRNIDFLSEARTAILHHHERIDGRGYPYGLSGGQIPELARVVAVADAFDAMTSTRSYRSARPVPAAMEELERCAGSQFDPRMVRALVRAVRCHGWVTAGPDAQGGAPASRSGAPPAAGQPPGAAPRQDVADLPVPASHPGRS